MKLYFVRHGQTDVNSGAVQSDVAQFDEQLNPTGVSQAEQLAEQLAKIKFDAIISSPSQRAVQTAEIINKFHKLAIVPMIGGGADR